MKFNLFNRHHDGEEAEYAATTNACPSCNGTGAACRVCNGRGCDYCGYEIGKPCRDCHGTGIADSHHGQRARGR